MNIIHFKQKLLAKQRELEDEIARLKAEAQSVDQIEVRDYNDTAEADEDTSDGLEEATRLTHTLEDVRDALLRIEEGSYGKCRICGRQIELARLEAVPWALYCLEDQRKRDQARSMSQGSTL